MSTYRYNESPDTKKGTLRNRQVSLSIPLFDKTSFVSFLTNPNLVGGAFQIDLPPFAGQRALEPQEETARALVVVLGRLRGQAFTQLLVIARVTVLVHALAHHVHLKRARTNPLSGDRLPPFLSTLFTESGERRT